MKKNLAGIILPMFIIACSSGSDNSIPDDSTNILPDTIVCCQAVMSANQPSSNRTEGDDSRGDNSTPYPLEKIHLLTKLSNYKPEKEIPITIQHYQSKSHIELCFAPTKKSEIIMAIADGKRVPLVRYFSECMFSSTSDGKFKLNTQSSLITPGKQKVLKPYGDRIFYSEVFRVGNSDNGDYWFDVDGIKGSIPIDGSRIPIELKRGTALIKTKLVITNIDKEKNTKPLTEEDFKKELGPLDQWSFQVFLDEAPKEISLQQILNQDLPSGKAIVALSENKLGLGAISHSKDYVKYVGLGAADKSNPYVFPMVSGQGRLCFSFYYKGNNKNFLRHTTLPIPLTDLNNVIEANMELDITAVIDYLDLKRAITKNGSKALTSDSTSVFGEFINIPYKTIVTKKNGK